MNDDSYTISQMKSQFEQIKTLRHWFLFLLKWWKHTQHPFSSIITNSSKFVDEIKSNYAAFCLIFCFEVFEVKRYASRSRRISGELFACVCVCVCIHVACSRFQMNDNVARHMLPKKESPHVLLVNLLHLFYVVVVVFFCDSSHILPRKK